MIGEGTYDAWLTQPCRPRRHASAVRLQDDYRAWLRALERSAQKRKLLLRRIEKYPLAARLWISSGHDAFEAIRLRVEVALERFGRRLLEGRQHHPLHEVGQGEVLRQDHLQGVLEIHVGLSFRSRSAGDPESRDGESAAPEPVR